MRQVRQAFALLVVALGVAGTGGPAPAASTLVFKAVAVETNGGRTIYGRVYAGDQGVITLGGRGWRSVSDAQEVARRLNALAEEGLRPGEIAVRRDRQSRTILARNRPIVTVDRATANIHRSDPARLADTWAENLRQAFGRPYLAMQRIVVPLGESRSARLRGRVVGRVEVSAPDQVIRAEWDQEANAVRVTGLAVGETQLIVSDHQNTLLVPVRAAKYAGRLAHTVEAVVTGNPAPAEVLTRAVGAAVAAGLALEPGAWAEISPWAAPVGDLAPGASGAVPVRISAAGEQYLPYHARPTVTVRNETITRRPADLLMVSNSPERLLSHGLWFEGRLRGGQCARLLYHHVNGAGVVSDLVVELWNLGDRPTRVHVIEGAGGPSRDEAWAGHRAAVQFLLNRSRNAGWIAPVPARLAVPVLAHRMTVDSTASGVIELTALGEAELAVRVYLLPHRSAHLPRRFDHYSPSVLLGRAVYPNPRREIAAEHVVGRQWAFVTIGGRAAPGLQDDDRLLGAYGFIYEIAFDLVNPTAVPAAVAIIFEPGGGPARGALLVDGRAVEAAVLRTQSEAVVARYLLSPGERRRVSIETMPQGGSNYPVRIVARPI